MAGGEARSVALETAYVHEVYEEISGSEAAQAGNDGYGGAQGSRAWPKVAQFLHELEPGALVCDVGCGNGKYLSINPTVFKIGGDRCQSLTEVARDKDHEVLVCDNLALPFRDECFDAVLSVAVVHHLATTERRVSALRELARVLRIGGKLIITVWAMEQRHRKFESQDVLVPWHRPQHLSTPSLEMTSTTTTTTSEEDLHPPYQAYSQTSDSDSCRSNRQPGQRRRGRSRHKGRSIDHSRPMSNSQSSSSLSSPNETCYSFVRRALQKLAGGKRSGPWFLDTWNNSKQPPRRQEPEGCEDVNDIQDLPIELRRLEEDSEIPQRRRTLTCATTNTQDITPLHLKSKSLSDILSTDPRALVRSRSSVPSLSPSLQQNPSGGSGASSLSSVKPRLVKQKQSMCQEEEEEDDDKPNRNNGGEAEGEEEVEEAAGGDQPTDMRDLVRALPDFKRIHSAARLNHVGSARTKLNVFKQSSMNEELMSAERLREKERVRQNIQKQASLNEELMYSQSTGHGGGTLDSLREKLFSASTANRFQLLKIGLTTKLKSSTTSIEKVSGTSLKNGFVRMLQGWKQSGDSTPQSTPPPTRQASCTTPSDSMTPCTPPPDGSGPKRPSSGSINGNDEPRGRSWSVGERRHSKEDGSDSSKDSSLQSDTSVDSEDSFASVIFVPKGDLTQDPKTPSPTLCSGSAPASPQPTSPKVLLCGQGPGSPLRKHCSSPSPPQLPSSPRLGPAALGAAACVPDVTSVPVIPVLPAGSLLAPRDRPSYEGRLQQIKDMFRQRNLPCRGMFPLVRRSSTSSVPRPSQPRAAPRLLSLEIFNPETDDVDSDSSGVSSPDSVDSVISVSTASKGHKSHTDAAEARPSISRSPSPAPVDRTSREPPPPPPRRSRSSSPSVLPADQGPAHSSSTPASLSLLEAVADVASSLEDAVEAVIQSSPRARRRCMNLEAADPRVALEETCTRSTSSLQFSPGSPPAVRLSRMTESVSRFSLPGSLNAAKQESVFKFPQTNSLGKVDSVRSGRRTDSANRLQERLEGFGLGRLSEHASPATTSKTFDSTLKSVEITPKPVEITPRPFESDHFAELETITAKIVETDAFNFTFPKTRDLGSISERDRFSLGAIPKRGNLGDAWSPLRSVPPLIPPLVPPLTLSPREGQIADGSAAIGSQSEDCWDEHVRLHLADFAEQLSERFLEEIEHYHEESFKPPNDPYLEHLDEELQGLTKLSVDLKSSQRPSPSLSSENKVIASLERNIQTSTLLLTSLKESASISNERLQNLPSLDSSEGLTAVSSLSSSIRSTDGDSAPQSDGSDPRFTGIDSPAEPETEPEVLKHDMVAQLRSGCSIESSDGGDFSERTGSGTDSRADSRRDTSSAGKTASSASLGTMESSASDAASDCSRDVRFADRRTARCDGRSSSEEAPPRAAQLVRQKAALQDTPEGVTKTESCTTSLSGSTSQDSLPSDNGGGAITFHRYYHVFREGELDSLIEKYVENLHIISSYYDHTNWCVVAEKVQVWTI